MDGTRPLDHRQGRMGLTALPPRTRQRPSWRGAVWLFPAAFALHVLEEAPGFTAWVQRYASDRYTEADFIRNNGLGLVLTAGATLICWPFTTNRPVLFVYYSAVLIELALFNTVFHAGSTVAFGAYSPGLVTALILFLPLWIYLTRAALREGLLSSKGALVACVIGGLVHAAAVAEQVFLVQFR